jgi:hypothetical protein
MLYDVGVNGTRSLRPELFGLSDSCGEHCSYTVVDDQSPINLQNLKNKNSFKMADMYAGFKIDKYVGGRFLKESLTARSMREAKKLQVHSWMKVWVKVWVKVYV